MKAPLYLFLIALLGVTGCVSPEATQPRAQAAATTAGVYLPAVVSGLSPAGSYDCVEYEFGMIWSSEVITLSVDGSSIYAYSPPYTTVVTGTWVYTPTAQEIGLMNFRWITATVELPDHLRASRFVPSAGFEVALSCNRRAAT